MRRLRTGKTLIELLVIITLLSAVMSMATTTLAAVFRVKQRLSRESYEELTLTRLASRLRTDAHQAIRCDVAEVCTLTLEGGETIYYAVAPAAITREVRRAGAVLHRDAFPLPRDASASLVCDDAAGGRLVRLTIRPRETPGREGPFAVAVNIEAALQLPPRLAGREGTP